MATYYSDIATAELAGPNIHSRLKTAAQVGRGLQMKEARVTTTAAMAADELINLCALPIGAKVIPQLCRVLTEASGGTGTTIATIGDAEDDDRYSATAIVLTSAANLAVVPAAAITASYAILAGNEIIKAKIGLASGAITAGKIIIFQIVYINP